MINSLCGLTKHFFVDHPGRRRLHIEHWMNVMVDLRTRKWDLRIPSVPFGTTSQVACELRSREVAEWATGAEECDDRTLLGLSVHRWPGATPSRRYSSRRCHPPCIPLEEIYHPMKHAVALLLIHVLVAVTFTAANAQSPPTTAVPPVTEHAFVIHNFKTESGATLPEAKIVYGTYGHLNAAGDNAILLPSHYMANLHGYEWLIGAGTALDPRQAVPRRDRTLRQRPLLLAEQYAGALPRSAVPDHDHSRQRRSGSSAPRSRAPDPPSSRPSSASPWAPQQAFQWAVSYPDFMTASSPPRAPPNLRPHGIVRSESEITAITTDAAFENGDYKAAPRQGHRGILALSGPAWLYSQEWWRKELWREEDPKADHAPAGHRQATARALHRRSRRQRPHPASCAPGRSTTSAPRPASTAIVQKALGSIKAPMLYMPSDTDLYFPVADAQYESQYIPRCTLLPIPSLWGHPAGAGASPADETFLNQHIAEFLKE